MVKVKEDLPKHSDGSVNVEAWLENISKKGYFQNIKMLQNACSLVQLGERETATETGESCLHRGLATADILADLEVDQETLAAAIAYAGFYYAELTLDDISEQLGSPIARLVKGITKMNALSDMGRIKHDIRSKNQIETIRKMLIAMVDDVRVVLIKLAERLFVLRGVESMPESIRRQIATETMEIYAPLANRLGIGALKWEMEDLAFRHLHPKEYKSIAKGLNSRRLERDEFVNKLVAILTEKMQEIGVEKFAVYGRSKHIHSIYKKMHRKKVALDEIYDATALRVLVETSAQCYEVLGMVHTMWHQVPSEFDDYIIKPKPNGYQSLHTAVKDDSGRLFEVQIRTFSMHELAEMGVAAHWKYKEKDVKPKSGVERKIEWLREVLAWQRDLSLSENTPHALDDGILNDRVYVFTPDGEVLDLPIGVTPLDFAYHIHSEVGHRCRGAKVNGRIVPLTYTLQTGDSVEILTGNESKPSRDWINPHTGYLKTSRAKAKVLHWLKMQDYDKNCLEGQEALDKTLKSLGIKHEKLTEVLDYFNFKRLNDLYAAIGRGDLKTSQVINRLDYRSESDEVINKTYKTYNKPEISGSDLQIEGVGNLLTHIAQCCQPLPGNEVIGYVTLGRGVSVHRKDCPNILHATDRQKERFLEVHWGQATKEQYSVDLVIRAYDRSGLLRDITSLLANEKAHVFSLQTQVDKQENISNISLTVEIDGVEQLSRLLTKLEQVSNVLEARRLV